MATTKKSSTRTRAPARAKAKKAAPKKAPARKQSSARSKKAKKAAPNFGKEIGRVAAFFRIPVVAVIQVARGARLKVGDAIRIKGHTTDFTLTVVSLQVNHQPVTEAGPRDEVGLKVPSRARRGDRVYLPPA